MDTGIRNYVLRETMVSMLINAALSLGFAWLVFGGSSSVERRDLVFDALPQSFFVAFFGALVPTLLATRRIRSNRIGTLPQRRSWLPANTLARGIAIGGLAAVAGILLHALVLYGLRINELGTRTVLVYKPIYGAVLAWIVTPYALLVVLAENRKLQ